jgi:LacI family transcriptional regulator
MKTPKRIAMAVDAASAHGRGVLEGVSEYAKGHEPWVFMLPVGSAHRLTEQLHDIACDGIIAQLQSEPMLRAVHSLNRPVVNISQDLDLPELPRVGYDNRAAGRMAAQHLIDRGLEHFAFVGPANAYYADERLVGFREMIEAAGLEMTVYRDLSPTGEMTYAELTPLARWLVGLPRPTGVFTADDERGFELLQAAQLAPLLVPDELVVVGCGNDELLVDLAMPSLSSVKLPSTQVGYEAAKKLSELMQDQPTGPNTILLEPIGVEARQSSEIMAVRDPDVAAAVRFIRDNAHRPLQVGDVLDAVAISRRSLERRFRDFVGKSPQQEIQRVHIERARTLLAETDLAMPEVAKNSGFKNADRLAAVFRRQTGYTPSQYRRRYRRR